MCSKKAKNDPKMHFFAPKFAYVEKKQYFCEKLNIEKTWIII